jgi:hypothetical protein
VRQRGVLQRRPIRGLRISELLRITVCITVSARSERRSPDVGYEFHVTAILQRVPLSITGCNWRLWMIENMEDVDEQDHVPDGLLQQVLGIITHHSSNRSKVNLQ